MVEVRLSEQEKKRLRMYGAREADIQACRFACESVANMRYRECIENQAEGLEPKMVKYLKSQGW